MNISCEAGTAAAEYKYGDCKICRFRDETFMVNGFTFCQWLSSARVLVLSTCNASNATVLRYPYWYDHWEDGLSISDGVKAFCMAEMSASKWCEQLAGENNRT